MRKNVLRILISFMIYKKNYRNNNNINNTKGMNAIHEEF